MPVSPAADPAAHERLESLLAQARSAAPGLQAAWLGGRVVLFSPASGAILGTGSLGQTLFDGLSAQDDAEALVERVAQALGEGSGPVAGPVLLSVLGGWEDAGLLAPEPPPYPEPVTAPAAAPATLRAAYATPHGALYLETTDPALLAELDEILGRYRSAQGAAGAALRCLAVPGGLGLFDDDGPLWGRADADLARFLLVREAAEALCGAGRVGGLLHGGAVCGEQGALILTGETGAGKSTLAAGLVAAGAGYLADDHVPLDAEGTHVLAFPVGAAAKSGAWALPEVQALAARHGAAESGRDGVRTLPLPGAAEAGTPVPVRAVVMPAYRPGAALSLDRIVPDEAFAAAVVAGARPARQTPRIAPLARLFEAVPAYRLTYGRSEDSVAACQELLSECAP